MKEPGSVARFAGLALFASLAVGCAVLPQRQKTEDPVLAELKQRVVELQRKAAIAEVEIDRLRQQVATLERRAPAAPVPAPAPAAKPDSAPAKAAGGAAPRARIEERDLPAADRPAPRAAPPQPAPSTPQPVAPPVAPAAGDEPMAVKTEAAGAEARVLYDQAYASFHQGRFIDSETAFRRFLQQFPSTDLSDNAAYWIGECRYARGDMKAALAAFQEAIERFPDGNKVPDALYKAGLSLESLGDPASARDSYREIVSRFPDSGAAALAQERLREIP